MKKLSALLSKEQRVVKYGFYVYVRLHDKRFKGASFEQFLNVLLSNEVKNGNIKI